MLHSPLLPDWLATIQTKDVFEQLLDKLAEGLLHYQKQVGHTVDLKEYFSMYTDHLLKQNKLHHYCKYKSQPVDIGENGYCQEGYCSKKPYNSTCPLATLKFGNPP